MFEFCQEIRGHFSDYLDGACSRDTLRSLRYHLSYCSACKEELQRWQAMQADLRALPRRRAPQKYALKLRVALSQELHRNLLGRLRVHLENALRPVLLPASAGVVLTAIICFGLIMEWRVTPAANIPDVPIQLVTPPRVQTLAPLDFNTGDQGVVLVTHIDAEGRVMDSVRAAFSRADLSPGSVDVFQPVSSRYHVWQADGRPSSPVAEANHGPGVSLATLKLETRSCRPACPSESGCRSSPSVVRDTRPAPHPYWLP